MSSKIVEIQINNTATPDDDYVTWGPTNCRIRISPLFRASGEMSVVLKNAVTNVAPNRLEPPNGEVSFATHVAPGETARESNIALVLPADGKWVSFVIAGRFPEGATKGCASSRDKDTVIEVHEGREDGPLVGTHRLMVRVRKDITTLTEHEKYRLLDAIATLHKEGRYEKFVEVHDWGSRGDRRHLGRINHPDYSYPDTAHRDNNFLPWHRIDLLQFERELQKTHPDVSLHYWKLDEGDPGGIVFSADMYGANEVDMENPPNLWGTPYLDFVRFSRWNPLHGWRIEYQGRFANPERLTRWPIDRRKRPWLLGTTKVLPGEVDLLAEPQFSLFRDFFESDTHNKSHHWIGPPMRDCTVAPADPFFWSFHSWFDRVWARWQQKYDRFAADGSNGSYEPLGKFDPDNGTHALGHHLEDTMWPWDGIVGEGTHVDAERRYLQSRPPIAPMGLFPESQIPGIWPAAATKPRVKDAIDYLGMEADVQPLGYCYDDTPFGKLTEAELTGARREDERRAGEYLRGSKRLRDPRLTVDERLDASLSILSGNLLPEEELKDLMVFLQDESDGALKSEALRLLSSPPPTRRGALAYALEELDSGRSPDQFQSMTLNLLNLLTHFAPRDITDPESLHRALRSAASPQRPRAVCASAVRTLAAQGDSAAISRLRNEYQESSSSQERAEVACVLSVDGGGFREHSSVLVAELEARDPASLLTVLMAGGQAKNPEFAMELVASSLEPERVRVAAIHVLSGRQDFSAIAINWLGDPSIPIKLKREALALLPPSEMSGEELARLKSMGVHLSPLLRSDVEELFQAAAKAK